jgi:hypothetical protein
VGSNNWVVAGSHTTTGSPLLANDSHLKLSAPALWYLARLEAPGIKLAGATMPGLPVMVLGQSEHIAWGFTNTGPDVQDLYIERVHPADADQVQTPEGWAPLKAFDEVIKVRGKSDVMLRVRESRHGPVISDAGVTDDLLGNKNRAAYVIAMRWTALDPDIDTVGTSMAMSRATDAASFIDAAKGGADAEHGGGRSRRPHRFHRARPRAAAQAEQRSEGPGAGAGLGRALRLGGLARRRCLAAGARPRARLDRHRQSAGGGARLPALPHQRVGLAVPATAHRTDARRQAQALDR